MLRQNRKFEWPKKGGLHTQQEQHAQHERDAAGKNRRRAKGRNHYFKDFDPPNQQLFGVLISDLPGNGGEQEERQNKQCSRQVNHNVLGLSSHKTAKDKQQTECAFKNVVVERPKKLSPEQRCKTTALQ